MLDNELCNSELSEYSRSKHANETSEITAHSAQKQKSAFHMVRKKVRDVISIANQDGQIPLIILTAISSINFDCLKPQRLLLACLT